MVIAGFTISLLPQNDVIQKKSQKAVFFKFLLKKPNCNGLFSEEIEVFPGVEKSCYIEKNKEFSCVFCYFLHISFEEVESLSQSKAEWILF